MAAMEFQQGGAKRRDSVMIQCRPVQMMIVGAQKAGTSSLQEYLGQHPELCTHGPDEMTFFVDEDEYRKGYDAAYPRYFSPGHPEQALMAKSAGVMYIPGAVDRLFEHNPRVQVVALLRNPVDRAYSAYWFCRRRGWEDLKSFEEALEAEALRLQGCGQRALQVAYLDRGRYAPQVARLFDRFGRDQVHVFLLEELKRAPERLCAELFAVLAVSSDFTPATGQRHNEAALARSATLARFITHHNPVKTALKKVLPLDVRIQLRQRLRGLNERSFRPPPMDTATRARLVEYFEPHNCELGALLGRDLSGWK